MLRPKQLLHFSLLSMEQLNLLYIRKLSRFLRENPCQDFDLLKEMLYPLLDKLYKPDDVFDIQLKNGLSLEFVYKSVISKEILLRDVLAPDHVWEPMTTKVMQLILSQRPGSCLICGAYFGDHAVLAANLLRSQDNQQNKVIAIEPNVEQYQFLCKNLKSNGLDEHAVTLNSFLWSSVGVPLSLDDRDSLASARIDADSSSLSITIDAVASSAPIGKSFSLIMLDIEGGECEAFKGASSLISLGSDSAPDLIFEVNSRYTSWEFGFKNIEVISLLLKHGYQIMAIRDGQTNFSFNLRKPELIPLEHLYLSGPPHGFNLIASKRSDFFVDQNFDFVENVSPKYLRHRDPSLFAPFHG